MVSLSSLLIALVVAVSLASSRHIYVSPQGDDVYGQGTKSDPYRTLVRAVGQSDPRDTILLGKGRYSGRSNYPLVEFDLRFESEDRHGDAVIKGEGNGEDCFFIANADTDVGFKGLTFDGCQHAVSITAGNDVRFENVSFVECNTGVLSRSHPLVFKNAHLHMRDTNFTGCGRGYHIEHNNYIDHLSAEYMRLNRTHFQKLYFSYVSDCYFYESSVSVNGGHIYQSHFDTAQLDLDLFQAMPLTIERTTFDKTNGDSIRAYGGLLNIYESVFKHINHTALHLYSTFATITGTTFEHCGGTRRGIEGGAIALHDSSALQAYNVHFHHNTADHGGAIYCHNSLATINSCDFENNEATKSGAAVECNNCQQQDDGKNYYRANSAPSASHCKLP